MADFLWRALFGSLALCLATGPLGCFVVWRRMAYLGDTLAHAALLGLALALALEWPLDGGVILVGVVLASLLAALEGKRFVSRDALLGIFTHGSLALGLMIISLQAQPQLNLLGLLYGDILGLSWGQVAYLALTGISVLLILLWRWPKWLLLSMHQEMAQVEGVKPFFERWLLTLVIAIIVALAIKVVGVLLVGALLIIPATTASLWSRSPLQMVLLSTGLSVIASVLGLSLSWQIDSPTGPTIVVSALILFTLSLLMKLPSR